MINRLAKLLSSKILKNSSDINGNEDIELYNYGLVILLSKIMFFLITIVSGLILSCLFESLVFYLEFRLIRVFAGGYHASSEVRCEVMSIFSILTCLFFIKLSKTYGFQTTLLFIAFISAICIFTLCPLDTPEKPLTDIEFKHYRKISRLILLIISVLILISFIFELKFLFAPSCLSLILESILLIAGKVKKVYQFKNAEQ